LKNLSTDIKIFKVEKVDRQQLESEQPPLFLKPESMTLQGHSISMENEGLVYNLYDYINNAYEANQDKSSISLITAPQNI